MTPPLPRLYVLPPSHFCERARWALDHAGVAFEEVRWAVGAHVRLAKRIAPGSSTPILEAGALVIQGSDRILDWAGVPDGDAALEQRFQERIGPLVRQLIYCATLHDPRSGIRETLFEGVPARQRGFATFLWPVTRRIMRAGMRARPALIPEVAAALEAELAWFEARLGPEEHLVGARFGRADITAASLLAPLARPEALQLYARPRMPKIEPILARWHDRPALAWARRRYAADRRRGDAAEAA